MEEDALELRQENVDNIVIVRLIGRLIYETERKFQETMNNILNSGKAKIILDMKELSYINSSGLGIVINILKQARNFGGDLKLIRLQPEIYDLFKITSLVDVFKIFENREDAVADF